MLAAKMNWELRKSEFDPVLVKTLSKEMKTSEAFIKLCLVRGLDTSEKINQFISEEQTIYHDPFLMHDMKKGVDRILQGIENGEEMVVYGDYDADGITSTAILVETIETLGGNVHFYLPNRFSDGYGPNTKAFRNLIEQGSQLIITCDNGVSGHEAISLAKELGVDVIVTDHHELSENLPDAYAIIHPRHPEGEYPFGDLSGAGVALKVATALLERIPFELFDIAAIGTVADLVSLSDENRWIVKKGIQILRKSERIGLQILYENAGIKALEIDEGTIGFVIGPRLNALGRMGDATPGVDLLISFDEEKLEKLVNFIQETNTKRQSLVDEIYKSAVSKMDEQEFLPNIIVLGDPSWQEGVLGIVASRMTEQTGRPSIMLHYNSETGIAKGSGRSVDGLDLFKALSSTSDLLVKFGGHQMAAGMSLNIDHVDKFTERINTYAEPLSSEIKKGKKVLIDEVLHLNEITIKLLEEVDLLKPFGTDNQKPIFGIENVSLQNMKQIGADNRHLKLQLKSDESKLDVIGFNKGVLSNHLNEQDPVSIIGELSINTWRDISKPQMQLKDIKSDSNQYFDKRSTNFQASSLEIENSVYLFFQATVFEKYANKLPNNAAAVLLEGVDDIPAFPNELTNLVFFDCPIHLDYVRKFLSDHSFDNYYFYCYPMKQAYLEGMPSKKDFASLFRYIRNHQNMDVRNKLDSLATYLNIHKNILIFMLTVFSEAKFVTIDSGILNPIKNPVKINLEDTEAFQNRLEKIEAEKMFIYNPFSQLISWVSGK
ncbi:single-stranded-DNA-specific exonuclease RecJ [Jeotgalibaca sp. MA1X17-3]|uniref:single-stranded-DNA-specific exonuclease RecJ n=1 Tax=Jeotgalibaca sp. MA1X17-3 TaxID=2908211 RepID=UPI001F1EA851|nr:single-stranded-DNA-specific exonuclease RecJ [Jeotgalibaca sp. MA1X17-3]UJF14730.1 single-stranded-DNA-specific exonuclease RecJ [Jeotgalibaca sp. MA1X17-3]